MTRLSEEQRIGLLQDELKLSQNQIDKYDSILERITTWTITLWVASLGWSLQVEQREIVVLNLVIVLVFWVLQGMNKAFRQDYKSRRDELAGLLNRMGKEDVALDKIDAPVFPDHRNLLRNTLANMFRPHSALIYVLLFLVSAIIYLFFP
jgi:hypothetical protein